MNQLLEEKLQSLNDNPLLIEAIKTLFNQRIELERPAVSVLDENTLIGEKYRAYEKAREILNKTFLDLESYKSTKSNQQVFNKGR